MKFILAALLLLNTLASNSQYITSDTLGSMVIDLYIYNHKEIHDVKHPCVYIEWTIHRSFIMIQHTNACEDTIVSVKPMLYEQSTNSIWAIGSSREYVYQVKKTEYGMKLSLVWRNDYAIKE